MGQKPCYSLFPENVWRWEAAEIALYCLLRITAVFGNGLFWSVSHFLSLQGWSRSMPCPSRGTMSCVSTWRTLKIAQHMPSTLPLEWASSRWTLMMTDTLWLWGTILAMQVCTVYWVNSLKLFSILCTLISIHYFCFAYFFPPVQPSCKHSSGWNSSQHPSHPAAKQSQ